MRDEAILLNSVLRVPPMGLLYVNAELVRPATPRPDDENRAAEQQES